jgi:hypothetical protein
MRDRFLDIRSPSGQQPVPFVLKDGENLRFVMHAKEVGRRTLLVTVRPQQQPTSARNIGGTKQKPTPRIELAAGLDAWSIPINVFEYPRIFGLSDFWLGFLVPAASCRG